MRSLLTAEAAGATDQDLEKLIIGVLTDVTRSGAPPRFSAEQVAGIIALACELGIPVQFFAEMATPELLILTPNVPMSGAVVRST